MKRAVATRPRIHDRTWLLLILPLLWLMVLAFGHAVEPEAEEPPNITQAEKGTP